MSILLIASALAALSIALLWWGRRTRSRGSPPGLGGTARVLGTTLLVAGIAGVSTSLWALTATDTSQLARAIAWGDSGVDDYGRFPTRAFRASPDPVAFTNVPGEHLAGYSAPGSDAPLEDFLADRYSTAFIVLHGDDLLYEAYFNASSHDSIQTSFSVAKSFTSALVGTAIEEGFISSLDDPLTAYLPELAERDGRFSAVTLRHLITMSSGIAFRQGASPWADPAVTYYGTDLRNAALTKTEVETAPGQEFHYNDWNLILFGLVIERATGMPVSDYMETRLWQPMGAEGDGSWNLDSEASGFEQVFVGINARAIDFAKLGWLFLHEGRNGDVQVVPATFVEEATRVDTTTDPASFYQYYWWIDEGHDAYYANGDHCQHIYVQPATDLVIVRHGTKCDDVDWVGLFGDLAEWLAPRMADE